MKMIKLRRATSEGLDEPVPCADPPGGRGADHPEKSQIYRVS